MFGLGFGLWLSVGECDNKGEGLGRGSRDWVSIRVTCRVKTWL